jgi:hypothetical protein
MSQALSRKLVIPEFPEFCAHLKGIFQRCAKNKQGKVSRFMMLRTYQRLGVLTLLSLFT